MKMVKVIKSVVFILALMMLLVWINNVIMYKSPYGITQYKGFYEQEKDSVDVLFVGTSHVYSDIDPAYVYDECGIRSYDLATGGASIAASYYSIRQALKYQHPDVIAVELFGICCNTLGQREIVDATYGIRDLRLKYASLKENIGENSILEFYMAFPWYHSLYNDVTRSDFSGYDHIQNVGVKTYLYPAGDLRPYKGATVLSYTTPCIPMDISGIESEIRPDESVEEYLNKIIHLCKGQDIELCFIVSPFGGVSGGFCEQVNYIQNNIAAPNNIKLVNACQYVQDMGIDWATDAAEDSHLNYKGAEKYSRWLGGQLAELYGLQDRHGTIASGSWEKNLEWENEVYLVFELLETKDITDNIDIWKRLDADVLISFNGGDWERYKEIFLRLTGVEEDTGKISDGLAMVDGEWKVHYHGEAEIVIEEGIDTISICSSEQGAVINCNGNDLVKHYDGINVVVYDKLIGDQVDHAAFTGIDELMCVR